MKIVHEINISETRELLSDKSVFLGCILICRMCSYFQCVAGFLCSSPWEHTDLGNYTNYSTMPATDHSWSWLEIGNSHCQFLLLSYFVSCFIW